MNIKQKVLEVLINNKRKFVSGQTIAKTIYCSRNAVWKSVKSLQNDGYNIIAISSKGYCLKESNVFTGDSVKQHLSIPLKISMHKSIPSTNIAIKEAAQQGEAEGLVIIAKEQTKGRGRFGRDFFSPADSGIYLSVLLRPKLKIEQAVLLTTAAAVAVVKAIKQVTGQQPSIKWVNDIFLNNKKVCGILTEAAVDFESGVLQYAALGIGLNIFKPKSGFGQIQDIADSVFNTSNINEEIKSKLTAGILNEFFKIYNKLPNRKFLKDYKANCFILGKEITVLSSNKKYTATAVDINENANLIVKLPDGSLKTLSSGEISVKCGQ